MARIKPGSKATCARERGQEVHSLVFLAILLASVWTIACRSPSHELEVDSNTVRLYAAPPAFEGMENPILESTANTMERVSSVLGLRNVTVDIAFDSRRSIPGYGVGGYTPNARSVLIWLDPTASNVPDLISHRLAWIVAHELHHSVRWRSPGYGSTLLEAMVSEGLADQFALQVLGGTTPPWTSALSTEQVASVHQRAASAMNNDRYDHAEWFFGSGDIPRWAGYTLGFRLVDVYLESNPGSTPAGLVDISASKLRPQWAPE